MQLVIQQVTHRVTGLLAAVALVTQQDRNISRVVPEKRQKKNEDKYLTSLMVITLALLQSQQIRQEPSHQPQVQHDQNGPGCLSPENVPQQKESAEEGGLLREQLVKSQQLCIQVQVVSTSVNKEIAYLRPARDCSMVTYEAGAAGERGQSCKELRKTSPQADCSPI